MGVPPGLLGSATPLLCDSRPVTDLSGLLSVPLSVYVVIRSSLRCLPALKSVIL